MSNDSFTLTRRGLGVAAADVRAAMAAALAEARHQIMVV